MQPWYFDYIRESQTLEIMVAAISPSAARKQFSTHATLPKGV
jgi:hypothetical protein